MEERSGGGLSKLSREQLLEYIKKQNAKVKKLHNEKEALQNDLTLLKQKNDEQSQIATSPVPKDTPSTDISLLRNVTFQHKCALYAISALFTTYRHDTRLLASQAFYQWKIQCTDARHLRVLEEKTSQNEELRKLNSSLEQK